MIKQNKHKWLSWLVGCFVAVACLWGHAGEGEALFDMTLEELMHVEVVSSTLNPVALHDLPAGVHILTREDIRRSGATSIPEALRMVPGINVARVNAHKWAVSARGFQNYLSEKMLVMIDGRSVYMPYASLVAWQMQGIRLEDIDRIEVILGPGGSVWGANAVNGIINVLTLHASDTQTNELVVYGGGEAAGASARYGFSGDGWAGRTYVAYGWEDGGQDPVFFRDTPVAKGDARDSWEQLRWGIRLDSDHRGAGQWMLQSEVYGSPAGEYVTSPLPDPEQGYDTEYDSLVSRGGFVLGRYTHRFENGGTLELKGFYDRLDFEDVTERARVDTLDLELHGSWYATERNRVTVGSGYRHVWDRLSGKRVRYEPYSDNFGKVNLFVQDELAMLPDLLGVIAGAKLEYDGYADYAFQPTLRIMFTPQGALHLWAAASGVVRTPSRVERHLVADVTPLRAGELFPGHPAGYIRLLGNEQIDAETLTSYECGIRVLPSDRMVMDLSLFYNTYDDLILLTSEKNATEPYMDDGRFILPSRIDNIYDGVVYGGELSVEFRVTDQWRLIGGLDYVQMDLDGPETDTEEIAGTTPTWSAHIRSLMNVGRRGEFDVLLYQVDDIGYLGIGTYLRADVRVAWHVNDRTEVSLVGQNLLEDPQREHYEPTFGHSSTPDRSVYARLAYRF